MQNGRRYKAFQLNDSGRSVGAVMNYSVIFLGATIIATTLLLLASPYAVAQLADAQVLVAKAILAFDDQQYDRALDLLNQALTLDPRNGRGLYYRGLVYLAQKKPE